MPDSAGAEVVFDSVDVEVAFGWSGAGGSQAEHYLLMLCRTRSFIADVGRLGGGRRRVGLETLFGGQNGPEVDLDGFPLC